MVVGAEPRCFGMRLENGRFLDQTYCKKPRDKFTWWERTYGLHNRGRRAMPTIGDKNWVLNLQIMCTTRCQLWEVYDVSRYKANSHLGSFVHSWSWRREVEQPINWSFHHNCQMLTMCSMSQLKKCLRVPEEQIPMEDLSASEHISYQEYLIKILETS
jgi:hypothetical protein